MTNKSKCCLQRLGLTLKKLLYTAQNNSTKSKVNVNQRASCWNNFQYSLNQILPKDMVPKKQRFPAVRRLHSK